jgi:hypothetical protein
MFDMTCLALFRYRNNCCLVCGLQQETKFCDLFWLLRGGFDLFCLQQFFEHTCQCSCLLVSSPSTGFTEVHCTFIFSLSVQWHAPYEKPKLPAISKIVLHWSSSMILFFYLLLSVKPVYGWPEHWQFSAAVSPHSYSKSHSKVCVILITLSPKVVLSISCIGVAVCLYLKVWVKVKFTLEEATKAQRGSIGIALFFL